MGHNNRHELAVFVRGDPPEPDPRVIVSSSASVPGCEAAGLATQNPIPGPESLCEPFRAVIQAKLGQGLSGQRIYQDLVESHGFAASYSTVRRFLRRLDQGRPLPFRRVLPARLQNR